MIADFTGAAAERIATEPLVPFDVDTEFESAVLFAGDTAEAKPMVVKPKVLTSAKTVSAAIGDNLDDFIFTAGTPSDRILF